MSQVTMYCTRTCPYCIRAEKLLTLRGVQNIHKIHVDGDPVMRQKMRERTGRRTVPQIYIGEHHIGGCDDLFALDRAGGLLPLLQA